MKENFSMEWKIFGMEWKWNGRKLPVYNMEKSSFIPFHTMPCLTEQVVVQIAGRFTPKKVNTNIHSFPA